MKKINNRSQKRDTNKITRGTIKDFRDISHKILRYATRGTMRFDFMKEVLNILIDFSGCDGIELRLNAHSKCYNFRIKKDYRKVSDFRIVDCLRDESGELIPCSDEKSDLEEICKDIFWGRVDFTLPFYRKNGTFWTGDLASSLRVLTKKYGEEGCYKIGECKQVKSLILISLSVDNEGFGLLKLISKQNDYFTKEEVSFYEDIAKILEIALSHRRAQVWLRERVKELTCLYGISQISEKQSLSLKEILKDIVELFPPAWLYPEITCAKIVLDDKYYTTDNYEKPNKMLISDIVIDNEKRGFVEVGYTREKPELDEGPFLEEERKLIDTIAKEIALIIEKREVAEEKLKLQEQIRHADRLATIGQISAGVAHELNEPLSSILGFAQIIQKSSKLPKQGREDLERIVKASLHAREVIKKLMIFARQMPPQKIELDLNQILEESLDFLGSRCEKENVEVKRSLSKNLPRITADPSQLTQVLVNLVINAVQAMDGGGKLTISTYRLQDFVCLEVEDTGVGMSKDLIKKIFNPFYTTKGIGKGTGLGLPVVHGIVSSHGGKIEVESQEGRGSRFVVKFPINSDKGNNREND
jgi:two-component system NtrC family sensor kinase